jgi:ABC-type Fe3+ transport system permease subunit
MLTELLVLLLAVPVGLVLAWLCRDELVAGRKYLRWLLGGCVVVAVLLLWIGELDFGIVVLFVGVMAAVSLLVVGKGRFK